MSLDLVPLSSVVSSELDCSPEIRDYLHVVQRGLKVITGKWKGEIICLLIDGPKRFNELKRGIPRITQHMLAAQLRDLERSGLILRRDFEVAPPRVEYELSDAGRALRPVTDALHLWANTYAAEIDLADTGDLCP